MLKQTPSNAHSGRISPPKAYDQKRFRAASFYRNLLDGPIFVNGDRIRGQFLATAVGDALGIAVETWTAQQIRSKYGRITDYVDLSESTWFKGCPAGVCSDDKQLFVAVAEAVKGLGALQPDAFVPGHIDALTESTLGWGNSTKQAVERLTSGFSWRNSALRASGQGAGNGVVMKIGALGAYLVLAKRPEEEIINLSADLTTMTHATNVAVSSSLAHIFATAYCLSIKPEQFSANHFIDIALHYAGIGERFYPSQPYEERVSMRSRLELLRGFERYSTEEIIAKFGGGTHHVKNSLPFSYAFFLKNPHSFESVLDALNAGGDTDSNAALVGGLVGALNGAKAIPGRLVDGLLEKQAVLKSAKRLCRALGITN